MFTLEACGLPAAPINTLSNTIMLNGERIFFFFDLQIHTSSAARNEERALRMALEEKPWGRPTLTALKQHGCIQEIKWQSDYLSLRHLKFCAKSILGSTEKGGTRLWERLHYKDSAILFLHWCVILANWYVSVQAPLWGAQSCFNPQTKQWAVYKCIQWLCIKIDC